MTKFSTDLKYKKIKQIDSQVYTIWHSNGDGVLEGLKRDWNMLLPQNLKDHEREIERLGKHDLYLRIYVLRHVFF